MALVGEYAATQSERAFETLVMRHFNLVYSAALRQARDSQLAEGITSRCWSLMKLVLYNISALT